MTGDGSPVAAVLHRVYTCEPPVARGYGDAHAEARPRSSRSPSGGPADATARPPANHVRHRRGGAAVRDSRTEAPNAFEETVVQVAERRALGAEAAVYLTVVDRHLHRYPFHVSVGASGNRLTRTVHVRSPVQVHY